MALKKTVGPASAKRENRGAKQSCLWLIIAAFCVAVGAIWWWRSTGKPEPKLEDGKAIAFASRIKEVPAERASAITPQPINVKRAKASSDDTERERRREMFSRMTVDEKIAYLHDKLKNTPIPDVPSNRLYATSLEQTMDWVFSCEVGTPPPLLPPMSLSDQMHLAEILVMDNPILATDSEKAAESKRMMQIAKKEFMQFIKDGGNPDEFLPYYHSQLVAAHEEWKMARQSIYEMVRKEPDIALEYARKVNAKLSEKGIKNVVIPQKMLDAFGIENDEQEGEP